MKNLFFWPLAAILFLAGCKANQYADLGDGLFADLQTTQGEIIVKLEYEKAPITVANFVSLAEGTNPFVTDSIKGKKYYDGISFHRIIKDFMIQGGDPTGTGMGNPGYKFKDEFNDSLVHDKKGILSMANAGPKTNGSQFFITHGPTPHLNGRHTVFGTVVEGINVVDSIASVPVGTADKPIDSVLLKSVEIIRNGKEAKKFDAKKVFSNYFAEEEEAQAKIKKAKEEFASLLVEQKAEANELPSGLKILQIKKGESSVKLRHGQQVLVNYAGWLSDGTLFDTSEASVAKKFNAFEQINAMHRGNLAPSPMDYSPDSPLVAGFKEGLLTMKVGDKVRLFIPPHLGYGPQGAGPIPPNSDLVFDLEITGIAE